jgi:hypothetical protein
MKFCLRIQPRSYSHEYKKARSFEKNFEVAAPVESVWKAITEGNELNYLEHHRGHASANVVLYAVLSVPPSEAWSRLMSAEGLIKTGSLGDLTIGAPFRFETSQGDLFAGVVHNYVPGKTFSAMVENLDKAILNIELSSVPGQGHFLYVSLNTWGLPKADVDALAAHLKAIVYGLFPQKSETPYSACAVNEKG